MDLTDLYTTGEAGYKRHRIPALVLSTCGTVLAFAEARRHTGADDDEIDIVLKRSFDGGTSWEPRQTVVSDGDRTCGNPCPAIDMQTGTIVLPFCKENQQVFITRSKDDGETWSTPVEMTDGVKDPAWTYLGTGPGHGIQLQSGRLLIPSWCDESPGPATWRPAGWGKTQSSVAFYSDDHGETWQSSEKMTTDASDEWEAVELGNGSIHGSLRSRQDQHCRAFSWSRDGGHSWSDVEYDDSLPEPSCQGSIIRYDGERILLAHPSATGDRTQLTIRLSHDGCKTWPVSRVLEPGSAAYSDLAVTDDGQILCLYEANNYDRLVLARFNIDWVESKDDSLTAPSDGDTPAIPSPIGPNRQGSSNLRVLSGKVFRFLPRLF